MIVWGRKKQQNAMGEAPDLDELIATLRTAVATNANPEVVGQLVSLLTLRGTVAHPDRSATSRRSTTGARPPRC